jgi:hypothetical protein
LLKRGDPDAEGISMALDLKRTIRVLVLALVVSAAAGAILNNIDGGHYGYDLRGIIDAARAIRGGHDPYVGGTAHALLLANNPYVLPPLIAELVLPLSWLPFAAAVVVFNLVCGLALVGAVRTVGVRDPRVYVIALCSLPFVASLCLGQPDGLFALALALAWRHRGSWRGGAAIAVIIAAKLVLWPLLLWLLLTRRFLAFVVGAGLAAALLVGTWAMIGFVGLGGYLHRLALDSDAFAARSHSVAAAVMHLGGGLGAGTAAGFVLSLLLVASIVRVSRGSDFGAFTAAIAGGLFFSPLLWTHYLVVLFVPLAIARRRYDAVWIAVAAFYLSPAEPVVHAWQIPAVLVLGAAIALAAARSARIMPPAPPTVADH